MLEFVIVFFEKMMLVLNFQIFEISLSNYFLIVILYFLIFILRKIILKYIKKNILSKIEKQNFLFKKQIQKYLRPLISLILYSLFLTFSFSLLNFGKWLKVLNVIILVYFLVYLSKIILSLVREYFTQAHKQKHINQAALDLILRIVKTTIILSSFLLVISNLGYDISALLTGLGIGGLAFALAAKTMLQNFFSGIMLIFDKTFNKGDRINFDSGKMGKVQEISLRTTKIKTFTGSIMTVPNSKLSDDILENVTKMPKDKVKFVIGLTYDTSSAKLEEAKKLIRKAINTEEYCDDENIDVYFDSFGESSLNLKVKYYSNLKQHEWDKRVIVKDNINMKIKKYLEKAKIEMAFPTQTIEIKK